VAKPGTTGIRRILRATRFSAQGFRSAWRHEAAFRQELVLVILMTPLGLWLGRSIVEKALLIAVLVLIVELFNSAIEAAIDRHGDEHHELSGRAKDMGSAAVFVVLVIVLVVWGAVAWQRFS
jgi:diacylglycerol kinase (ATP)